MGVAGAAEEAGGTGATSCSSRGNLGRGLLGERLLVGWLFVCLFVKCSCVGLLVYEVQLCAFVCEVRFCLFVGEVRLCLIVRLFVCLLVCL